MSKSVPKVTLFHRGEAQFQADINFYITSKDKQPTSDGIRIHELYTMSMFGPHGSGTSLRAIFAGLVSQPAIRHVEIEGLGLIALMHKSSRIENLGYVPSWSCDFTDFGTHKAAHAVVEPKMLSLWDPQQAVRGKRSKRGLEEKGKNKSLASSAGTMNEKAKKLIEKFPIFLLMVPTGANVEQLYLDYLDKRCPFPLIDDWAEYIWNHANGMFGPKSCEELLVWNYQDEDTVPMIDRAYLCYPNITQLITDLSGFIAGDPFPQMDEMLAA